MIFWVFISVLLAFASSKSRDTAELNKQLLLSLNKDLLRSLETQDGHPNPSVHLALRLSNVHNLAKEGEHLNQLKTRSYDLLQVPFSNTHPGVGQVALYTLALRSSCYDLSTVSVTTGEKTETLLMRLKRLMEQEKDHIGVTDRPLTNYYQYALGIVALCTNGVRVNSHVSNKLIKAVEGQHLTHGDIGVVDTYAMAGMALQCVKDGNFYGQNTNELDTALGKIKQKLLDSRGTDNHIGNQFSTGLAVQALIAMGSTEVEFAASIEAMRTSARNQAYQNPMAVSQVLPALHQKSYLKVKNLQCANEDDSLVLEPLDPVVVLPSETKVPVNVEVVSRGGMDVPYSVVVPRGSTLLQALELLMVENDDFTFDTENSMWGTFLSAVNGEQARQSDRGYWHVSSNDVSLQQGIGEFKIQEAQTFTLRHKRH